MSVVTACKDKLQSGINQVLVYADMAQKALAERDYVRCAQCLEECAKYCAFDATLLEVFQALTDEHKAKVAK